MNDEKQFELMSAVRAYAQQIVDIPSHDTRPSTAKRVLEDTQRMLVLAKQLDTRS